MSLSKKDHAIKNKQKIVEQLKKQLIRRRIRIETELGKQRYANIIQQPIEVKDVRLENNQIILIDIKNKKHNFNPSLNRILLYVDC